VVPAMRATKIVAQIVIVAAVAILTLVELAAKRFKRFLIFIVQKPPNYMIYDAVNTISFCTMYSFSRILASSLNRQ
jgi:hypothetical protein